jgi:hypothetical protein
MEYARTVVGYHGCDESFAKHVLHGRKKLKPSVNDYDWLGNGIYFWEYGAHRAYEWAKWKAARGGIHKPAVIGALIQLGTCFDLLDTRFTSDLAQAFGSFRSAMKSKGWVLPRNDGRMPDRLLRRRDCAVVNWYLAEVAKASEPYQTVRCAFSEGKSVFPGAGMKTKNHIQIAVRDPTCIVGVFRPTVREVDNAGSAQG